jgi:hypothetical protein
VHEQQRVVSAIALLLCYAGRLAAFDAVESARRAAVPAVNLNEPVTPEKLEVALAPAFAEVADRRLAARVLARELAGAGLQARRPAPANVGSLVRVEVPADEVGKTRGVRTFAERITSARERAVAAKAAPPAFVPLLTTATRIGRAVRFSRKNGAPESYGQGVVFGCGACPRRPVTESVSETTVICPVRRRVSGTGLVLVTEPYPVSRTTESMERLLCSR